MQLKAPLITILALAWSSTAMAQSGFGVLATPTANRAQEGRLDLVVEGETFVPLFYSGRSEPSAGNQIRVIAIPDGTTPGSLTFRWTMDGQVLPETDAVVVFNAPAGSSFQIGVTASLNGQFWAERNEVVAIAEPTVLFYEGNSLKGLSQIAIDRDYLLVGDEAEITTAPYFTGTTLSSLRGTWRIDGQEVSMEGDWRQLVLTRPEAPQAQYKVELTLRNMNNLAESVRNYFNLQMGL